METVNPSQFDVDRCILALETYEAPDWAAICADNENKPSPQFAPAGDRLGPFTGLGKAFLIYGGVATALALVFIAGWTLWSVFK
jgi:hypothetical protein